jgi:hypothetical protein
VAIERIEVRKTGRVEIRFSRWQGTKMMPRALALGEEELLPLVEAALRDGVFSEEVVRDLRRLLHPARAEAAAPNAPPPVATASSDLERIEGHFHDLIRSRAGDRLGAQAASLPGLSAAAGTEEEPAVFRVEGMDGVIKYWWDSSAPGRRLMSESWSRQVSGSGQLHEVTPAGARLLAEGFI